MPAGDACVPVVVPNTCHEAPAASAIPATQAATSHCSAAARSASGLARLAVTAKMSTIIASFAHSTAALAGRGAWVSDAARAIASHAASGHVAPGQRHDSRARATAHPTIGSTAASDRYSG